MSDNRVLTGLQKSTCVDAGANGSGCRQKATLETSGSASSLIPGDNQKLTVPEANLTEANLRIVKPLTQKERMFVERYAEHQNGTRAAKEAGYAPASAAIEAVRLLKREHVWLALTALRVERDHQAKVAPTNKVIEENRAKVDPTAAPRVRHWLMRPSEQLAWRRAERESHNSL